ncbi:MAG: type II secretion system protein, partial [Planctomycetaceae bacterium]
MIPFALQQARRSRRGFTLVEMLVSVGLVVLMMSLFAFIFQVATGTMSRQRTISQNNQKVRLVATLLTNDLKKRTFRNLIPFMPHELEDHPTGFSDRRGYFYLSENSAYVETDTVLQFTVDSQNTDDTALVSRGFVGRAQAATDVLAVATNPIEHPDSDNGRMGDSLATARHAEVTYFIRNGNLYRRLLLIRNERPTTVFGTGNQAVAENYNFSRFDFSMRENMATPGSAEFSAASDLDNVLDPKPAT